MSWFYTKFTDLIRAIELKKWDVVEKIFKEHCLEAHKEHVEKSQHELKDAAYHISKYFMVLRGVHLMTVRDSWNNLKRGPPSEQDQKKMLELLKGAERDVQRFEKLLKQLIKEGKFLE